MLQTILFFLTHSKKYFQNYYVRQEPQSLQAYICKLPNLGDSSTQRAESSPNDVKQVTIGIPPLKLLSDVFGMN